MNILFICSRNQWRSRTAEDIFKNNGYHSVRSAGTADGARIQVSHTMMEWADIIFVMEQHHKQLLKERFPQAMQQKKTVVLHIPDEYGYMDEELISMLKDSVTPYL